MDNHNLMLTQLIEDLEKGKASVEHIRELLNQRCPSSPTHDDHHHHLHDEDHQDDDDDQDCYAKGLDHHSMVALRALDSALSMLHSCESVEDFKSHTPKSMDSHALASRKDRRGCYKRRRNVESMVKDIDELSDDGFAWRKYGQKVILNTKHPRNYFRCTHKIDQGCLATKQVQQISENPTKYRIIYHGRHTCKSNITSPPIFLDSTAADNPDSPVYLNFGATATSPAKHALLSPPNLSFSHASSSAAMVKQEQGPIREETSSEPSDHHQYNSSSSSPSPSSPDPTTTTPRSGISSAEAFSSVTSTNHMDEDEDYYSQLMTLTEQFDMDSAIKGLLCV